jgi:HAD superfamily hydrolase (TIGR01509 family)
MDGVLVDSERYWVALERERILPAAVEEPVDPAEITGMNVSDLYDYLRERYEVRESRGTFVERYDEAARRVYGDSVALLPEFESLAAALADAGVGLALVSSSPVRWIEIVTERFGLDAFDTVVSAEHAERGKPAPDVYELAVDRLGVDAGEAVAVEDSTHGVTAATSAGCSCIGYASRGSAGLSGADRVVDTPAGLRRAVREAVGLGT